jgi:hypothetical protein
VEDLLNDFACSTVGGALDDKVSRELPMTFQQLIELR